MWNLFEEQPTLRIAALSDIILLTPNIVSFSSDDEIEEKPTCDTICEGTVTLSLPSPRHVKKLQVEVISKQNTYIRGNYETAELLHKVLELDTGGATLEPGDHQFAFSFVIPADAAPHDRAPYGRTYQRFIATAFGIGKLGTNLVAEDTVAFITNHSATGDVPPGFSLQQETHSNSLGPVGVNLSSKHLLVAGYLRLALTIPSISEPVRLESVTVQLYQTYQLQSNKHPERTEQKTSTVTLWTYKSTGAIGDFLPGQEFSINEQFRLPDDDKIRPSTSEGSKTGLRASHRLAVCIRFTPIQQNGTERDMKELKIAAPAVLSSCCCIFEALQLPAYSKKAVVRDIDWTSIAFCRECLCRIADNAQDSEAYGVPKQDILEAVASRPPITPFKDDEEYRQQLVVRTPSRSPSPPAYRVASSTHL